MTHHAPAGSGSGDFTPTLEDLRLSLSRPATPGDLAWLWTKINGPASTDRRMPDWYQDPMERDDDLDAQVRALFVTH